MKPFQVALAFIFGALALVAVFIFATFSGGSGARVGDVSVWGSVPEDTVEEILKIVTTSSDGYEGVEYREIAQAEFIPTLVEAIAAGRGPDLVLFPTEYLVSEGDKLAVIPYSSLSRRDFQDTFLEAGEILLTGTGAVGLPFLIDPFVTYWNRTLFSAAGVAKPPLYWDEVGDLTPRLTQATQAGTLTQSAVALGQWDNVVHAKHIFLSLLWGLGNNVVVLTEEGELAGALSGGSVGGITPAESALGFYTEFADPVQRVYSWNRSMPDSRSAFLAGDLALYFGTASEARELRAANPNLNFDVAPYPTVRDGRVATPARLVALAIPRGAGNVNGALQTALLLSGTSVQDALRVETGLPSVRRDVSSLSPENPYEEVFRQAALNAFTWYDPEPTHTNQLFKRMVEDVASGRESVAEAVRSGQSELAALLDVQ